MLLLRDDPAETAPAVSKVPLGPGSDRQLPATQATSVTRTAVAPPILTPDRAQPAEVAPDGVRLLPGGRELVIELNNRNQPPERDLEILDGVLSEYRRVFGQNPPGGLNAEITAALLGANDRGLAVIPSGLPAVNSAGELVDRWDTPYFFHPVSRTIMEVLSAGPDGRLWTSDDVGKIHPASREVSEEF